MKKFLLCVATSFGLLAVLPVSPAKAHDPIILTSDQQTPIDGPLLLDGTISFALYGSLTASGDTRGFRVNFNAGDPLYISLLIPDLAPENILSDESMPYLNVEDPNGLKTKLAVSEKVSFAEPYTGTNYVRLTEINNVAVSGTYLITVTGDAPARFTVSVGQKEMFGTTVENIFNRDLGVTGVMNWYSGAQSSGSITSSTTGSMTDSTNEPTISDDASTTQSTSGTTNTTFILVGALALVALAVFARLIFSSRSSRTQKPH